MSLVFTKSESNDTLNTTGAVIVCGNELKHLATLSSMPSPENASDIYDMSIVDAEDYLGSNHFNLEGFPFVNRLWLKRCIHAGLLHGVMYDRGDYFFSMNELNKLRENIIICGGTDPLDMKAMREYYKEHQPLDVFGMSEIFAKESIIPDNDTIALEKARIYEAADKFFSKLRSINLDDKAESEAFHKRVDTVATLFLEAIENCTYTRTQFCRIFPFINGKINPSMFTKCKSMKEVRSNAVAILNEYTELIGSLDENT